jgi:hypothetical protein
MLLRLSLLLVLIASVAGMSGAPGNAKALSESLLPNPTPGPAKAGQNEKTASADKTQKSTANNTPANESVPTVNQSEAPRTSGVSENAEEQKSEPSSTNWWIALFTAVLAGAAVIQVFIYVKQAGYMRETLQATQINTAAAQKSAEVADKSLRLLNRPFVDVHFDQPFRPEPSARLRIRYTIKNSGMTWAFIKKIRSATWDGPDWLNYSAQPFSVPDGHLPTEAILPPGETLMRHVLISPMEPGGGFIFPREGEPNDNEVDQDEDAN